MGSPGIGGRDSEDSRFTTAGAKKPEQGADRRRLASTVRAKKADHFTGCNVEAQLIDGDKVAETFDQAIDLNGGVAFDAAEYGRMGVQGIPFTRRSMIADPTSRRTAPKSTLMSYSAPIH